MKCKAIAVIPAFNEQAHVRKVVERAVEFVDYVVVVDDGSVDGTFEQAGLDGAVEVLRHPRNMGVGAALRTGIAHALQYKPGAIVLLDADGQHDPEEIPSLLRPVLGGEAHLAVGMRDFSLMSLPRHISNSLSAHILRRFYGVPVGDVQCGFRAVRADALGRLTIEQDGYPWAAEQLIKAARLGLKMADVPIETIRPASSHIKPVWDTLRFLHMLLREKGWREADHIG